MTSRAENGEVIHGKLNALRRGLGERLEVMCLYELRPETLERGDGQQCEWRPALLPHVAVHTMAVRDMAVGDRLRVSANDYGRGLLNGDFGTITAITVEAVKAGAGCEYHGIDLGTVEAGLLSNLGAFIGTAPSGVEGLDEELEKLDNNIGIYHEQADNLVTALAAGPSPATMAKLREVEQELGEVQATRSNVLEKIATGSSPVLAQRLRDLEGALSAGPLDRPKANALMRSVLASVVVDYPNGTLNFEWKHGGNSSIMYAWPLES